MGNRQGYREIKAAHAEMSQAVPDAKAQERFRHPAYQAGRMVQEQGRQIMGSADKYGIGRRDVDGQGSPD